MPVYLVEILITNKPLAKDPEGETIHRDLLLRSNFSCVKKVRVGKLLMMEIEAKNEEEAKEIAFKACNDLRIYNPVAHTYRVEIRGIKE
ncbi:MAG: phosphoribosylformylglycinamidine synthase subunit PurS [Candidatus Njordarchaeales archaeon]